MATSDLLATSKRILQLKKEGRIEQALQRAEALTVEHPGEAITHCVLGDVNFAAAVRAREAAAGSEEEPAYGMSPSETHIRKARDALFEAKALAPDSVDIALALANILIESRMFSKAEAEYRLALQMDMDSTTAAIQAISGPFSSTPKQRSEACQRLANRLVSYEVSCIMATDSGSIQNTGSGENGVGALTTEVKPSLHSGKMDGGVALKAADGMPLTDGGLQKPDALAMKMSKEARSLANRFPGSARAQLCYLLVQLQYMRSLPRNLNMSKGVKRLVNSARSAAQAFPNSVLIAMFHAKLLLLSGRLDLAAAECHRAIYLEDVTDPEEECVPPGSIEGHDLQARLSSVAGDFELLLKKIIESAEKCWENSLTTDIKRRFLLVKISALQNEYAKVDKSPGSNIQSALNFIKQNDSWRFWMCPLCSSNKRHSTSSLLMDHMHKKHARIFLPRLKSVISSTLDSDSDGLCHGMSFTQDKDNHDIIQFEERSGLFRWLFSAAIRGEKARPFDKIAQENRTQGTELLEIMKQKMASLPTEKSTTYESPMLDEIREIWLQFLKSTVFDYGKILLTLARTLLWSEFKEHMAGVLKDGCQNITADDVDDAFSTWSNADTQKMKEDVSYPTESQKPTNVSVDQEAVGILNLDLNFSDINLMDIALKALWSLNHFSHELIKAENPCSKNNHDGPCVGDIVHRAFCSWWKGEYPREELASLAKTVHKILDAAAFQKDQINCISDITFAILNGLHLPDLCLYIGFVGDTSQERIALKYKFHDSLGMKFLQNMSCGCQTCSSEKSDLDANIVEQQCSQCSSAALKERYSIIAVHWSDDREGGPTLPEIFSGRLEPTMTFKYEHGEAFYKLSAMVRPMVKH